MHQCVFYCVRRKVSINMCCRRSTEYMFQQFHFWHNSLKEIWIFSLMKLFIQWEVVFLNHANQAGHTSFPGSQGELIREQGLQSLWVSSFLDSCSEKNWDGGIHWGGFRSLTIAMVSQLRYLLTDREKATEPADGSSSFLLHNPAMTLKTEHFLCTSEIHYFLKSPLKRKTHKMYLLNCFWYTSFPAQYSNNK